jgi:Sec-independent protein translocase protein TatA
MIFGRFGLLEVVLVFFLLIIIFGPKRLGKIGRDLLQGFTSMQDAAKKEAAPEKENSIDSK